MKIQDFNHTNHISNQRVSHRNWARQGSVQMWNISTNTKPLLEIFTAALAFLLPAVLLFLIAAK